MVVIFSICGETALVDAGGHYRGVVDFHKADGFIVAGKGLLNADPERLPVWLGADAEHVSPQIDDGAFHSLADQVFLQAVCDKALGDGSQIQGGVRREEGKRISLKRQIFIAHLCRCRLNVLLRRNDVLSACEVPERA